MTKTFKKSLALILSVIMLMSVVPMSFSVSAYTYGDFEYSKSGTDEATITKYNGTATEVEIPEKILSYTVVGIGDGSNMPFNGNKNIISVSIPSTVKTVAGGAFMNCSNLETVIIGIGLITVERNAFGNCNKVSKVFYAGSPEQWESINWASGITNNKVKGCEDITYYNGYDCNESGHLNNVIEYKAPTCTEDGNIKHTVCKVCGIITTELEEGASVIIPALHKGLKKTEATDATCVAAGNYDYWYCEVCDTYFADADANTVYENGSHNIAVDSSKHEFNDWYSLNNALKHKRICTVKDCTYSETADCVDSATDNDCLCDECEKLVGHNFVGANCSAQGVCSVCNETGKIDANVHTLEKVDANAPTCFDAGNIDYWQCKNCNGKFDENGTAITDIVDPAKGHNFVPNNWIPVKNATCTETGLKGHYYCELCNSYFNSSLTVVTRESLVLNENGHTWSDDYVDGEDDKHYQYCTVGGCTALNEDSAQDHSYNEGVITTPPTCTETGVKTLTCTVANCGATKTETVEANGHTPGVAVKENEVPMECDKDGSYDSVVYCEDCDEELSRTTETVAHGHLINLTFPMVYKKQATCTEAAIIEVVCGRCAQTLEIPVGEPLGHTEVNYKQPATCTEDGKTGEKWCTVCLKFTAESETIPALGHDWEELEGHNPATCLEDGVNNLRCKREGCGATDTNAVTALGHDYPDEWTPNTGATCTDDGVETKLCDRCKSAESIIFNPVLATGHDFGEEVEAVEATCVADGNEAYKQCETCNLYFAAAADDKSTEGKETADAFKTVNASNHNYATTFTVDAKATCTTDGSKSKHCSREGCNSVTETTIIPARNHTLVDDEIETDATCTETGVMNKKCSNTANDEYEACNHTETAVISAKGHNYAVTFTVDAKATCTTDGSKSKHCLREGCNSVTETTVIPARNHTLVDTIAAEDETCLEDGIMNQKCSNTANDEYLACTYTTTRPIEAEGHDFGEVIEAVEATCVADGNEAYKQCSKCELYFAEDATITSEDGEEDADAFVVINRSNHNFATTFTVDAKATCTTDGSKSKHCLREDCDSVTEATIIPARNHALIDDEIETDATCTETGVMNKKCSNTANDEYEACTYTTTRPIEAAGHDFGEVVEAVEATCVAKGNAAYKQCEECEKYFAADAETTAEDGEDAATAFDIAIVADNHDMSDILTSGKKHYKECKRTGCTYKVENLDHNKGKETVTKEATCQENGEVVAFCNLCLYDIKYSTPKVDCKDGNNDKKCDWCGKDLTPPATEDPGTGDSGTETDKPSTPEVPSVNCDCGCHATGIKNLLFKFLLFFQKFLKLNSTCDCGKAHY